MTVKILNQTAKQDIVSRVKNGMTKADLAKKYGVSADTIRRVCKEMQTSPAFKALAASKIATAIKAPVQEVKEAPFIWNANSKFISITQGRETWNADADHPNFKKALQSLVDGQVKEARDLINVERAVKNFVKGNVRIENGSLFYKDLLIDSGLTKRILGLMEDGKEFQFLLPFLENLMMNVSRKAVYRLYDFLEANDIEITADGHFIAWKKVASDFKDIYTGTMDNSPGKTLSVPRNQVDEDDSRTCSQGLHVCSKSYLGSYGSYAGNKVVSVKVHPKDVVSIPVDYNNAKMRTTGYIVLEDKTEDYKAGKL